MKWIFNSNLGSALTMATIGFLISSAFWFIRIEDRVTDLEETHIKFHFTDDKCVIIEHDEEYYCIKKEFVQ